MVVIVWLFISADAFSLVSDSSGRMTRIRLDMFIQELLILPAAVFESPSFEYSDGIARNLFDQVCALLQFGYGVEVNEINAFVYSCVSHLNARCRGTVLVICAVWARGNPVPLSLHFPTFYYIFPYLSFFPFSLSFSFYLFSCFFIPSHSARIVPLHFQAGCHRRRLNLALVILCVDSVLYVFLFKDVCLFL